LARVLFKIVYPVSTKIVYPDVVRESS
jgi:hypothetical protein